MKLKKKINAFKKAPTQAGTELQSSQNIKSRYKKSIDKDLFEKEIIGNYLGADSGIFVILPKGKRILGALVSMLKENVSEKFAFREYALPKIVNPAICSTAKIVGRWDDYLLSVKPFGFTHGSKEEFILDPLQCTSLYAYLENKKIEDKKLPLKVLDISGPTYRNEDKSELRPLIKQLEFHRAEFAYFGYENEVVNLREKMLCGMENICFSLNIPFRRVVGAGCYEVTSNLAEFAGGSESIPIIDLEMLIPGGFTKRNKKINYLEVAGASVLRDQQTSRFRIKTKSGKALWSGCMGIGLERLMYAFIANNGFDEAKWPKFFRKYLDKKVGK